MWRSEGVAKLPVQISCISLLFPYLTHTGDSDDPYLFLRKYSPLLDYLALFCLLLTCFGINKNHLKQSVFKYSSIYLLCVFLLL